MAQQHFVGLLWDSLLSVIHVRVLSNAVRIRSFFSNSDSFHSVIRLRPYDSGFSIFRRILFNNSLISQLFFSGDTSEHASCCCCPRTFKLISFFLFKLFRVSLHRVRGLASFITRSLRLLCFLFLEMEFFVLESWSINPFPRSRRAGRGSG